MNERCNICHRPAEEHKDGLFCCPFCGSPAELLDVGPGWRAMCSSEADRGCGVETANFDSAPEYSRRDWNDRASPWVKLSARPLNKGDRVLIRRWPHLGWVYRLEEQVDPDKFADPLVNAGAEWRSV